MLNPYLKDDETTKMNSDIILKQMTPVHYNLMLQDKRNIDNNQIITSDNKQCQIIAEQQNETNNVYFDNLQNNKPQIFGQTIKQQQIQLNSQMFEAPIRQVSQKSNETEPNTLKRYNNNNQIIAQNLSELNFEAPTRQVSYKSNETEHNALTRYNNNNQIIAQNPSELNPQIFDAPIRQVSQNSSQTEHTTLKRYGVINHNSDVLTEKDTPTRIIKEDNMSVFEKDNKFQKSANEYQNQIIQDKQTGQRPESVQIIQVLDNQQFQEKKKKSKRDLRKNQQILKKAGLCQNQDKFCTPSGLISPNNQAPETNPQASTELSGSMQVKKKKKRVIGIKKQESQKISLTQNNPLQSEEILDLQQVIPQKQTPEVIHNKKIIEEIMSFQISKMRHVETNARKVEEQQQQQQQQQAQKSQIFTYFGFGYKNSPKEDSSNSDFD